MEEVKTSKLDYVPSKKTDGYYALLVETSDEFQESWYYFIRVEGNEENLSHLSEQLQQIKWYIIEDMSTFDLVMDKFVSAQTAKEMTKIDINSQSFHRKFDGTLQKIDFKFKNKNGNTTKMGKVFDLLGNGGIENFINDEDLDEEDLISEEEDGDDEKGSDEDESEDEDEDEEKLDDEAAKPKLPPSLLRNKEKML